MAVVGSAYIRVNADTSAVRGEIEKAFKGIKGIAKDVGEKFGKDFSESFGKSLSEGLDGLLPDILREDLAKTADEAAADFADQFSTSLSSELADVVANTLEDDRDALQASGEAAGRDYAASFSESLRSELDGLLPDVLKQDVIGVARESAADYSDEFSDALSAEMADVVSRTLADDSDGVSAAGVQDAGEYTTGFADALNVNFDTLIPDIIGRNDLTAVGENEGQAYAESFASAVRDTSISPSVDQVAASRNGSLFSELLLAQATDTLDERSGAFTDSVSNLGSSAGRGFVGGFANALSGLAASFSGAGGGGLNLIELLGGEDEIRDASRAVTSLIGFGNLIGPAIAQAVAALSALASGLFSVGSAALQAAPALIVFPSYLSAIGQAAIATTIAFQGVGNALKVALDPKATVGDLRLAFKDLAPAAQEFVLAVRDVRDEALSLRTAAAQGLFPGLTSALENLTVAFPVFRDILKSTTTAVGELAETFSERITDPGNLNNISIVADTNVRSIRTLGTAFISLGEGFTAALAAATPLIDRFSSWIASVSAGVSAFLQVGAASGRLTDTFNQAGDVAAKLGGIFGNLTDGLLNLGRAASPAGQSLLDSFTGVTEEFSKLTQAGLESGDAFTRFGQIAENFRALGELARGLVDIFIDLGANDSVAETFTVLQEALPSVRTIVESFSEAGPALAQLAVSALEFVEIFTDTQGITIFLDTLRAIVETMNLLFGNPLAQSLLGVLIPVVAVSRGIQFAWQGLGVLFKGILGSLLLNVKQMTLFSTEALAARAAGASAGVAITAGMNAAAAATTKATVATKGLTFAQATAAAAGATGSIAATGTTATTLAKTGTAAGTAATKVGVLGRALQGVSFASRAIIGVPVSPAFAAFAAGAAPVAGALYLLKKNADEATAATQTTAEAFLEAKLTGDTSTQSVLQTSTAWETYTNIVGEGNQNVQLFNAAATGSEEALAKLQSTLTGVNPLTGELVTSQEESSKLMMENGNSAAELRAQLVDLRTAVGDERAAMDEAAVSAGFLDAKHQALAASAEEAAGELADTIDYFNGLVDAARASRLANAQVTVSLRNLDTSLDNLSTKGGKLTAQGFLDFDSTFEDISNLSNELLSIGKVAPARRALFGLRESLIDLRKEGVLSKKQFQELIDVYNLTPSQIRTRVLTTGLEGAKADLARLREELKTATGPQRLEIKAEIAEAKDRVEQFEALVLKATLRKYPDIGINLALEKGDPEGVQEAIEGVAGRVYQAYVDADAKTGEADKKLNAILDKKYGVTIDAVADTRTASVDIEKVASKAYRAVIDTGADPDEAERVIERLINKQYGTKVDVTADTSGFTAAVNSAVTGLQYEINANSGGLLSVRALAEGGILPGYRPGKDIIPALLSPGEAVLRPQAVRALGPDFINALNRDWNRVAQALRAAWSGNMPKFATGGIVGTGSLSVDEFSSLTSAIIAASRTSNAVQAAAGGAIAASGDTYIINPAPGMDEVELAAMVSRRQAFTKRRGS